MYAKPNEKRGAAKPLLLAAILGCSLSVDAAEGEIPSIYGTSNIGTLENGAITIERDTTRPNAARSIEAVSPCATTFSGPSSFPWVGTYNGLTSNYAILSAGASFPGCTFTATSDSTWLVVTSSSGPNVTYGILQNGTPNTLTGHIRVLGAGAVFTLTITVRGNGPAYHSNDYFGDGTGELAVWRPSTATWYVKSMSSATNVAQQWGLPGDKPVLGDFDGDGVADFTVWRPSNGTWYMLPSSNVGTSITRQLGLSGDIPVPADYDGDGKTDMAVFRPSTRTWYVLDSSTQAVATQQFGLAGDIPVPADFDGDGKTDIAVWRPATATWYFLGSFDGLVHSQQLGLPTDIPVLFTNFYFGYLSVWRPSTGQFFLTSYGHTASPTQLGLSGDIPLILTNSLTVWRPTNGTWYVGSSSNAIPWGLNGDVIPQAPHTATQ